MTLFPFFEDIDGRQFLVIGGGGVARRKVESLLRFTDRITVIAPDTQISGVQVIRRRFVPEDLDQGDYVIAATGDRTVNAQIAQLCHAQGRPVNVVDDPQMCTWFYPAVIRRGPLTVAVSTNGASPAYAGMLRAQIEELLPEQIEEILQRMQKLRAALPQRVKDQKERQRILRSALCAMLSEETLSGCSVDEILKIVKNESEEISCGEEDQ